MYNCKTISPICVHPYNIIDLFYSNKQFRDLTSNLSEKRSNKPSNKQRQKPKLIGGFAEGFFPDPLIIVTWTMARRHFDCWTWKLDNNIRGGGFEDFYVHPYLGRWSNLNIFLRGWNHQLLSFAPQKMNECPDNTWHIWAPFFSRVASCGWSLEFKGHPFQHHPNKALLRDDG